MCQQCIDWLNNPLVPPFPPAISILPATKPCREQRNHRRCNHRLFSRIARSSPHCRRVCSHPPVSWREINARVGACTLPRPERTVPFAREHSHRAFPFSRWFTARTCLGRCRSHNGESCRRRSPPDTVITGWHLPGPDHNDNGRFAGKTSSYTPALPGPRERRSPAPRSLRAESIGPVSRGETDPREFARNGRAY